VQLIQLASGRKQVAGESNMPAIDVDKPEDLVLARRLVAGEPTA